MTELAPEDAQTRLRTYSHRLLALAGIPTDFLEAATDDEMEILNARLGVLA